MAVKAVCAEELTNPHCCNADLSLKLGCNASNHDDCNLVYSMSLVESSEVELADKVLHWFGSFTNGVGALVANARVTA